MAFEILEYAANVRQARIELDEKIADLRHNHKSVEWTQYCIASQEVIRNMEVALCSTHSVLMVISRLVSEASKQEEHFSKVIADYKSQIEAQQNCIDKYEQDLHRTDA